MAPGTGASKGRVSIFFTLFSLLCVEFLARDVWLYPGSRLSRCGHAINDVHVTQLVSFRLLFQLTHELCQENLHNSDALSRDRA